MYISISISLIFSFKLCKQLLKDDSKSPLFTKNGKTTQFTNYIYNLLLRGIHGTLKKEAVVNTLAELVVCKI